MSSRHRISLVVIAVTAAACGSGDARSGSDGGDASIGDARAPDADSAVLGDAATEAGPDASDTGMCREDAGADGGACSFVKCMVNADCCCSRMAGFAGCWGGTCVYEGPPN